MNKNLLSDVWADVWTDLGLPGLRWQIVTLLVCVALGWGFARLVRKLIGKRELQQDVMRIGVESFIRVLSPLLSLALIALSMPILARFDRVDLLRVAIPLVGSFALIRLAFYIMRRIFAYRGQAGVLIALFEKTFALIVWIVVALHITGLLPDMLDFFDKTIVHFGRNKVSVLEILQAVLSVGVTLILALWAAALMEERLMRVDTMHSSLRVVMSRLGRAVFILVAVLVSLSLVGIDLTVLSVFSGALGVGLGLGLQKIASSYVSGFVILFERSLSIGDVVTVDKFSGRVTQINTRYTVLRGGDGSETVVPNEMFVSAPVQNFSLTDKAIQAVIRITVDYRTDIELALRLLEQSTLEIDGVDLTLERAPKALMIAFAADGIELELSFWLADLASGKNIVTSNVNRAIWNAFQVHHINVPFPQRVIRLIDEQSIGKKDDVNMPKAASQHDLRG